MPRRLPSDRPPAPSTRSDLSRAISSTLADEARSNETRIAYARAFAVAAIVVGDWARALLFSDVVIDEATRFWQPTLSTAGLAASVALLVALRRGFYRRWLRFALPVWDTAFVTCAHVLFGVLVGWDRFAALGSHVSLALGLALVIAAAALRFDRVSTALTALLASAGLVAVAAKVEPLASAVYQLGLLVAAAALALWTSTVVERAARSRVARLTLERFLPEHVVNDAHLDPVALLTEPRQVDATVLVSDLRDFTSIAEQLSPTDLFVLLNELHGRFAAAVRRHGGTVDKFMGDGMLAVFGAAEPQTDHPARALAAAADIRAAVAAVNAARKEKGWPALRVGVGLHTGPVLAGCVGAAADLEFTVIGDTVNTAARLEALTKEHGVDILLSEETAARTADLDLRVIGDVPIRGKRGVLRIHTLGG